MPKSRQSQSGRLENLMVAFLAATNPEAAKVLAAQSGGGEPSVVLNGETPDATWSLAKDDSGRLGLTVTGKPHRPGFYPKRMVLTTWETIIPAAVEALKAYRDATKAAKS